MDEYTVGVGPFDYLAVCFETAVRDHGIAVCAFNRNFGLGKRLRRIADNCFLSGNPPVRGDLLQIALDDHVGKWFILDLDCPRGILSSTFTVGHDGQNLVSRPLNFLPRALNDFDRLDPRHLFRNRGIDADDSCVGVC
jgi:hypothetical protein